MSETARQYTAGQIWQYETREGEEASRVIILKVERVLWEEVVIHIAVLHTKVKNPMRPDGISAEIRHLPFAEEAIDNSLTNLESEDNELPDYIEGYNQWKASYKAGEGGIFSIPVKEAVQYVEEIVNR